MLNLLPRGHLAIAAAVIAVLAATGAIGALAWLAGRAPSPAAAPALAAARPVWTGVAWPFPKDPWASGKAFRCRAEHCGTEVVVYLRAKVGLCGCVSAIDDDGVERGADLDLLAKEWTAEGPGRAIDVRWMKGRSRTYALGGAGGGAAPRSAVAVAFHERCDMIVATAAVADNHAVEQESAVIDFLNGEVVLRWAEVTLGL